MAQAPKSSRKHHFVTQAQLKYFSINTDGRQIWVFDKSTDRAWISSIRDAGSQNDFNTVDLETGKWNFESLFQDIDDISALLIAAIVERNSVRWFGPQERKVLNELFATQMLRTSFSRTAPRHLVEHMREMVRSIGYDPDNDPDMSVPTDVSLRLGAVRSFLNRDQIAKSMGRLVPVLFAAGSEQHFILSDHPIVVQNAFPYGENGLASLGITVMLPLSPILAVALVCPTIIERYEAIDRAQMEAELRKRMESYRDGFRSGRPIEILPTEVDNWNNLQVVRSARYLYAAADNFDFAREVLSKNPKLRQVVTHITTGQMGHGPPRRSQMPAGLQLVVHGRFDHCMIPIAELDQSSKDICGRATNIELLRLVAEDPGDLRVVLYDDGQERHGMAAVKIERFGEPSEGWFRVVHRDASLQALMEQINARRAKPD